jgi:L-ascorbate metabolism protein UlaG (beta-lactamase superfamily)
MVPPAAPLLAALLAAGTGTAPAAAPAPEGFVQPRAADGRFLNLDRSEPRGLGGFLRWQWDRLLGRTTRAPRKAPIPRAEPDLARLRTPPGPGEGARLTWIGHATWLVQLEGLSFLTDPVLSDSLPGFNERNAAPGIPLEALPRIDAALVSHNHYDHLDVSTLRSLGAPVVAGLGTGTILRRERIVVTELGWWQSTQVGGVRITFVPAQHFSQRGLADRNRVLWGGFVVESRSVAVYHAGDTAWFPGFEQIGARFPIDAALLPIGAYDPAWFMASVHLSPEQALRAFVDLRAATFFAMHWGTFKLADEPLDEPPRRLEAERLRLGLPRERVRVLAIGETAEVRRQAPPDAMTPAEPVAAPSAGEPGEPGAAPALAATHATAAPPAAIPPPAAGAQPPAAPPAAAQGAPDASRAPGVAHPPAPGATPERTSALPHASGATPERASALPHASGATPERTSALPHASGASPAPAAARGPTSE